MANTGNKIVLTLKQVIPPCPPCTPTGQTKPNTFGDPDYIAPYQDLTDCPLLFNLDCPIYVVATGQTLGRVQVEFNVFNSVLDNPAVAKVKVSVMDGATEVASNVWVLPNPTRNYFAWNWTGLSAGSRSIRVEYLDSVDGVLASCPNLVTINVS